MNLVDITAAVRDLGFPIIVAGYLLLRLERTLKEMGATLNALRNTLAVLNAPWNGNERRSASGRVPWKLPGGSEAR